MGWRRDGVGQNELHYKDIWRTYQQLTCNFELFAYCEGQEFALSMLRKITTSPAD